MSELIALLDQLSRLAATPLLIGLIVTAAIIAIVRNWRVTLPALIVQYVLVGILLARVIPAVVALITPIVGAIVALSLSLAAQRADSARASRGESVAQERIDAIRQAVGGTRNWRALPSQFMLRAVATMLVLTAAFGATFRFPLPGEARELGLAAYVLIACAMLVIATAPEAINLGMGVLMLILGVEMGYSPLEPSVTVSVLLGLMTLLVGVAVAYLALADGSALHVERREPPVDERPIQLPLDFELEAKREST